MTNVANWVREDTVTTGTGAITLGTNPVTGFATFQNAFGSGTLDVYYSIESGDDREAGIGSFNGTANVLTRTDVASTFVSGVYDDTTPTAITLSGTSTVRCTFNAAAFGVADLTDSVFPTYATFDELYSETGSAVDFANGQKQTIDGTGKDVTVAFTPGTPGNFVLRILNSDSMTSIASATEGSIDYGTPGAPILTGRSDYHFFYDGTKWTASVLPGLT